MPLRTHGLLRVWRTPGGAVVRRGRGSGAPVTKKLVRGCRNCGAGFRQAPHLSPRGMRGRPPPVRGVEIDLLAVCSPRCACLSSQQRHPSGRASRPVDVSRAFQRGRSEPAASSSWRHRWLLIPVQKRKPVLEVPAVSRGLAGGSRSLHGSAVTKPRSRYCSAVTQVEFAPRRNRRRSQQIGFRI
jgi:hypothetical protein